MKNKIKIKIREDEMKEQNEIRNKIKIKIREDEATPPAVGPGKC